MKPWRPWRRPPGQNLRTYLVEGLRWKIANTLNRLPGQCWSSLVDWVLYEPEDVSRWNRWRLPRAAVTETCIGGWFTRPGEDPPTFCYCGKVTPASRAYAKAGGK